MIEEEELGEKEEVEKEEEEEKQDNEGNHITDCTRGFV